MVLIEVFKKGTQAVGVGERELLLEEEGDRGVAAQLVLPLPREDRLLVEALPAARVAFFRDSLAFWECSYLNFP